MNLLFVVNLWSGKARAVFAEVKAFAEAHGHRVATTAHRGHATDLARGAVEDGCEGVVAVGGDGTMNEVARALVGTDAVLGLVPCGSGDGLGRHLGVHGSAAHALGCIAAGTVRTIDTGVADGHPFFTAAGLGFEAEIAHRFNALRRRGFARYLSTSARAFWNYHALPCRLMLDAASPGHAERTPVTLRAFTIAVANANQYGNNARIAPPAQVDDGLLNLTAIPNVTAWNGLSLLARLFGGTIDRARGVITAAGREFVVERPAAGLIHTDGELHEAGAAVRFAVRPASLRVFAPAMPVGGADREVRIGVCDQPLRRASAQGDNRSSDATALTLAPPWWLGS